MPAQKPLADVDPLVRLSDFAAIEGLGDAALMGQWFVFLKAQWLSRSGLARLLELTGAAVPGHSAGAAILFRGGEEIKLPGASIAPKPLPRVELVSITCDKALYRAGRDTVRLLIAAPQQPGAVLRLKLRLSGNPYADYPLALDQFGLCLWSLDGLPEGEYEASLQDVSAAICRFEVAEYRLAPLHAELAEQTFSGETLRYVLAITAFGQPYSGPVEVELQERGQRSGQRETLTCNREGQCRGAVRLSGKGPYTLNVFAGERSASVALKGSEQERRETLVISELGEVREISLLPLPQSNQCRGVYIVRGGVNTEPFLVQRVVGKEVEITARVDAELLRVVVVDPARGTFEEKLYHHVKAQHALHMPIPAPYGLVLLGAFIDGQAWEGWCAILHPSDLQLHCAAPKEAKPGERITITLTTNVPDRTVPVHLVVKDQRLIAPSDTQVEFAACIKQNVGKWREESFTGGIERHISSLAPAPWRHGPITGAMAAVRPMMAMAAFAPPQPPGAMPSGAPAPGAVGAQFIAPTTAGHASQATATLARIRFRFPEILYNKIVYVREQAGVEVTLGEGITRYSIEAFALAPAKLDWQRVETTLNTVQPVFGELTVSPFVFSGDPVMGRLDVSAASGGAIVEVRHDGEVLPLAHEDGSEVSPGLPIPSGSVVRFPVQPGMITSYVRDARKGGVDVSEQFVSEPGKLRHIARSLRLLTPGDEVTLQEQGRLAIKPLPGLERPFQFFVEAAAAYPFGCIEQTSTKIVAMFAGYYSNQDNQEAAGKYEAAIPAWYRRLKSMYLPGSGFCFYPPAEGGARKPDTHYAPQAVKRLLSLPRTEQQDRLPQLLRELVDDITAMASDAAAYYKIEYPPRKISNCHDAYALVTRGATEEKARAVDFARSRLVERDGQTCVAAVDQCALQLLGQAVAAREETAYAAATLLLGREPGDLRAAIAATNYLASQLNEEGRLYSTVDTAACLALLLALRSAGVITTGGNHGRVALNGQEMAVSEALKHDGVLASLRCLEGVIAAEITTEVIEDWSAFKSQLPVEVRLERNGRVQQRFKVGDALDLVIRVSRYEPGLLAHVCLPDALARVVGGGQVKRFSLDFCERNELRVPLAAVGSTVFPSMKTSQQAGGMRKWFGRGQQHDAGDPVQHWAVIVRNMFKEDQVGNPGLLQVTVE